MSDPGAGERKPGATRSLTPPQAQLRSGDEPIAGAASRLADFWSWCLSDLRTNTVRPMLAEFLVARALGAADRPRVEWESHDVCTPEGIKVEVKSGAYLQAWEQSQLSTVRFSGLNARTWTSETGYAAAGSYNADVYVFAVQTATSHDDYDALNVDQWSFWVLPRHVVEQTGLKSMQLSRVQALAGSPVQYLRLAERVRSAATERATPTG